MSSKVLVIPEDPTLNGYLLKPLVKCVLDEVGRTNSLIQILRDPKVGGFDDAKRLISQGELASRYGHYDLWLFLPDGDRQTDFIELEENVRKQRGKAQLIACAFQPEIEICVIAGHPEANRRHWKEKRREPRFKEIVFTPFLLSYGNRYAPGGGRQKLMEEALTNYTAMRDFCPELKILEERIRFFFSN